MLEVLTPAEMGEADRLSVAAGPFDGPELMRNAGVSVAAAILARFPDAARIAILCGPGNNGGDGYVTAARLAEAGAAVTIFALAEPRMGSDAARAAQECPIRAARLADYSPAGFDLVVDGLFGAGLDRPVAGEAADVIERTNRQGMRVVAIDLPSGISGGSGKVMGVAFEAALTVTFFRKKPGHLLYPGKASCGEVAVTDIGISPRVLGTITPRLFENAPGFWPAAVAIPDAETHKYKRGHCAIFTGGASSTGAGRLAAMAALRSGAGAVTVLSPPDAMLVNGAHLTAIMLRSVATIEDLSDFTAERKTAAFVLGPGFGVGEKVHRFALALLGDGEGHHGPSSVPRHNGLVLDGDGITAFSVAPNVLFETAKRAEANPLVLTPHEGEFGRLFPDLAKDAGGSKIEKAREAAARSGAVVVYKGPDTVVAAPDGRAVINANGVPWLATAGSGDVLAGTTGGLLAHGLSPFEAACAAAWLHAEAGRIAGGWLIAEDLPGHLPAAFASAAKMVTGQVGA